MWLYDFKTKCFINVNESAIQHYGYSKDEFLTLKLTDIIVEDTSISMDENEWLTGIRAGKTNEYLHTMKNGNIISVEVNAHIVHLNDSEDNIILEVLQDITLRKNVEAKIEESEQRFKTLAKISPVAIFRTNSRGELTYMNENWTEMTGIFAEIAFGRKWWDGLPIQDKNLIEQRWKRSVQVSNSFESEFELLNPKSKVKWVLAGLVNISSVDEKVMGYVGTLTDITRMKMFEGNFRKLYYSVEQSPVSIVITDTKGNIEFVNPAVLKTTGYSKDELMGNNPSVLKSGYQDKVFYKNLWDTISSGKIWQGELNNKRKDGTNYWEHASISPVFNERKEITNYVAVKEDITAKKSLYEELVKAKNDALESSRIKTNFLTKINHELRTPLVGIIGCSHSVFDEAENSRVKELGKILIDESARLNNSLKSILSLSSLETEDQNPNLEIVDVSAIVKNLQKQFLKSAAIKNISFTTNDFIDKIYVNANNEMLNEILSNLIDNAIKFTERGSIIIYSEFADDKCIISVKDTGIGIPDDSRQIIFEPFRQAEGLTKQSGGIGLGLTLAKKYTEVMGGKLWFETEINNGTTFHLSLNLVKESEKPVIVIVPAIIPVAEKSPSSNKKKLLIVEDDEINLRITQMYLRSLFDISVAENSTVALENVATNKFDIILMDIGLKHGLNGMELTKILRKMPECAAIPIIAITAFTLAKDKEDIMNAGCSHYLAKPFVKEELLDIVKKALK
jgi:PAS domain S-box-containing protein